MHRTANFTSLAALVPVKRDAAHLANYYSHFLVTSTSEPTFARTSLSSRAPFDCETSGLVFHSTHAFSRSPSPLTPATPPPTPVYDSQVELLDHRAHRSLTSPLFFFPSSSSSSLSAPENHPGDHVHVRLYSSGSPDESSIRMTRSDTLDSDPNALSSNCSSLEYQGTLESTTANTPDRSRESFVVEFGDLNEAGLMRQESSSRTRIFKRLWKQLGRIGRRRIRMVKSIERRTNFILE